MSNSIQFDSIVQKEINSIYNKALKKLDIYIYNKDSKILIKKNKGIKEFLFKYKLFI